MRHDQRIIKATQPLSGQSVLLAEDEGAGRWQTERRLAEAGARVLLAQNAYQATLVVSQHALTAAVIDADIGPHTIACISELLRAPALPFLFLARSGELPEELGRHVPHARTIDEAIVLLATFAASPPPSRPAQPALHALPARRH